MLSIQDKKEIINMTETTAWEHVKQLFQNHKDKIAKDVWLLNLDEEEDRKFFKDRRNYINAFENIISMVEWTKKEEEVLKELNLIDEDFVEPQEDTKKDKETWQEEQ